VCGNGTCEALGGENCSSCAADCVCPGGQYCNGGFCESVATTTTIPRPGDVCGDANGDEVVTATDALATLRAATGAGECAVCLCDVDSSESITATDALALLRKAVGEPVELFCVSC